MVGEELQKVVSSPVSGKQGKHLDGIAVEGTGHQALSVLDRTNRSVSVEVFP